MNWQEDLMDGRGANLFTAFRGNVLLVFATGHMAGARILIATRKKGNPFSVIWEHEFSSGEEGAQEAQQLTRALVEAVDSFGSCVTTFPMKGTTVTIERISHEFTPVTIEANDCSITLRTNEANLLAAQLATYFALEAEPVVSEVLQLYAERDRLTEMAMAGTLTTPLVEQFAARAKRVPGMGSTIALFRRVAAVIASESEVWEVMG